MDINDLKKLSATELAGQVEELRREQFNLRMQRGTGQLTQTHQLKRVRKDIARVKTVMGQKE
ncbi:MAG: 50S ribosomal protein L29 [Gammaproteobacteria bacterium]|nr:50S ribosomal protein L29 [Gammaproteobacteria bacterium]